MPIFNNIMAQANAANNSHEYRELSNEPKIYREDALNFLRKFGKPCKAIKSRYYTTEAGGDIPLVGLQWPRPFFQTLDTVYMTRALAEKFNNDPTVMFKAMIEQDDLEVVVYKGAQEARLTLTRDIAIDGDFAADIADIKIPDAI